MPDLRVSVRALAEFALEQGDLMPANALAERMQEGMRVHKLRQSAYEGGFESEVALKLACAYKDMRYIVYGRADGLNRHSAPPVIEEIKTTRLDPRTIGQDDNPVYWAQTLIYAHMLCQNDRLTHVEARLTYMHMNGERKTFTRTLDRDTLAAQFMEYFLPYAEWTARVYALQTATAQSARALAFPFDEYRDGQRKMAAQAYRAIRDPWRLLAQAPTGIGKTAAALFAALKAMGEGLTSRIFYLTARTTARQAAEDTLELMRARGLSVRAITLTAKEKLCPQQGACDPTTCPFACGYYDRRRDALRDALAIERLHRDAIIALANKHQLCPFEMQLDISESCDVVICDYNYAFDPVVRLRRFFQSKTDAVLLIDEAHNLPDRAREMLSAHLRMSDFRKITRQLKALHEKNALYDATKRVLDALKGMKASYDQPDYASDKPESLIEYADMFLDEARPYLGSGGAFGQALTDAYFAACAFLRAGQAMDDAYRVLYMPEEHDFAVRIWCADPSAHLQKTYAKVRSAILFSATLSPIDHYFRALGLDRDAGDRALALPSPFPPENLLVVGMDIDTRFSQRAQTVMAVAQAIVAMAKAKPGNYLACFPSYAYLALAKPYLAAQGADIAFVEQARNMTDAAREAFLRLFVPAPVKSMVALIAMGGAFAEGIDLPGDRLSGAAIVGVGLPQPSLENHVLAELTGEDGFKIAYMYPGVERVLQAAGRVIRTENDLGVVLLIDARFQSEDYLSLLPEHWRVRQARDIAALSRALDRFWTQP